MLQVADAATSTERWGNTASDSLISKPEPRTAIIKINEAGSITEANTFALELFGATSTEEVTGMHYSRFLRLSHVSLHAPDAYHDPVGFAMALEQPLYSVFGILCSIDERLEPIEASVAPLYRERVAVGAVLLIEIR